MKHRLVFVAALVALFGVFATSGADAANPFGGGHKASIMARKCATPEPTQQEMAQVGFALRRYSEQFGTLAVGGQIKVAFHVIYSGSTGNIPQSQIDAQIAELNKAYSGFYGGVNTGYTFVLASVDRRNSSKWFRMAPGAASERQAKQALAIDIPHRLNIYTCAPGQGLLGWSYLPNSYPEGDWHHGVVIHYGSVPGGYLAPFDLGGTADHEVGHYLGLYHTFQNGCSAPGDQVADTPDEATATSGCPGGKDTCPSAGLDPIHNYMDYSDDACYSEFTAGQDARMDAMVPTYRPSLLNAAIAPAAAHPSSPPAVATVRTPATVEFRGAFPNPSQGSSTLAFYLPSPTHVMLRVYDLSGRVVATLVNGEVGAGEHSVTFHAPRGGGSVYFARFEAGSTRSSKRLIVIE